VRKLPAGMIRDLCRSQAVVPPHWLCGVSRSRCLAVREFVVFWQDYRFKDLRRDVRLWGTTSGLENIFTMRWLGARAVRPTSCDQGPSRDGFVSRRGRGDPVAAVTCAPAIDTPEGTVPAENSAQDEQPIDVARLLRLQGSPATVVAELRTIPEGSIGVSWLWSLTQKLAAEADGVVPADLLGELHRLIPFPRHEMRPSGTFV
jgi:hypothetical protein